MSESIYLENDGYIAQGDCLELMKEIPDHSVNLICCDLPYGVTANKWDKIIPFDMLWAEYERVLEPYGVVCLFAQQPFTSKVILSNLKEYRYSWIWQKEAPTSFLNANYSPLKMTEDICIFSKGTVGSLSKHPIRYYPQGLIEVNKQKRNNPNSTWRKNKGYGGGKNLLNSNKPFVQKYTNYPNQILKFSRDKNKKHPAQKPVALLEYLIKTYTKEGEGIVHCCTCSNCGAEIEYFIRLDEEE